MTSYSFSTNFTKLTTVSLLLQSKTQTKLLTISAVNHAKVKITKTVSIWQSQQQKLTTALQNLSEQ